MYFILVIYTIVAGAGTQFSTHYERDWRPIGEFATQRACEEGAKQMNVDAKNFRCLKKY